MKPKSATVMGILLTIILTASAWAGRPIPDTGQTQCYDDVGGTIACPGTGQDGAYNINPMSFTKLDAAGNDLSDDAPAWVMVRDNVTGLIWEVKQNKDGAEDFTDHHDADNTYFWYDPDLEWPADGEPGDGIHSFDTRHFLSALNNAHFGGFNDWRLPTSVELQSLVDFSITSPGPTIQSKYFPNTVSDFYWTIITHANVLQGAWSVSFYNGLNHYGFKDYPWNVVRAVRGRPDQVHSRLVVNDSETVTDRNTGLMWRKATYGDNAYIAALSDCELMMDGGYDDWRMPTLKDLSSLADLGENSPAIDVSVFPDTLSAYYWSSTTNPKTSSEAWAVDFTSGRDEENIKAEKAYFRPVRGGQILILGNIVITSPRQASNWDIGSVMPIMWDPGDVPETEQVEITLSRTGGGGTLQQIAVTENDGYHEWKVSGLASWNGWLEITPTSSTWESKATGVGMFSLQDYIVIDNKNPSDLVISETPGANTATFRYRLIQTPVPGTEVKIRLYSGDTSQCMVSPSVLVFDENNPTATVTVTALDDSLIDGDHVVTIFTDPDHGIGRIESTDPDYRDMPVPTVDVTIQDDEAAPSLVIESLQPNTGQVASGQFSTTIYCNGMLESIFRIALVLEDDAGNLRWDHEVVADSFGIHENYVSAVFPEITEIGQYTLVVDYTDGGVKTAEKSRAVVMTEADTTQKLAKAKAVIVAGRRETGDYLWNAFSTNADRAFEVLHDIQGYPFDNIRYYTHATDIDWNKDGFPDKTGDPTPTALNEAITGNWPDDADDLLIYMVDHGSDKKFHLDENVVLEAADLKNWLDALQSPRAIRVTVIIDACMSGSFVPVLRPEPGDIHPGSERIVIASASFNESARSLLDGRESFSRYFWDSVDGTSLLYTSFINAREKVTRQIPVIERSMAGVVEDHSGIEPADLDLHGGNVAEIIIGVGSASASTLAKIGGADVNQPLGCETSAVISASNVTYENSVHAEIIPPGSSEASPEIVDTKDYPTVKLTDPQQNGSYTAVYEDFTKTGTYKIQVYALDDAGRISNKKELTLVRTCGATNIKADLNRDTKVNLTDAIIALRILAGVTPIGFRTDYQTAGIDVNGNDPAIVDLAEAVFALQKTAELR